MWSFKKRRSGASSIDISEFLHDEGAENLHDALLERDWNTCRDIFSAADREHFMYYLEVAATTEDVQEWIHEAIRDEPESTLPLLVRGARTINWAWQARGSGTAKTVTREQ